jgi:hypothetical protein
VGSKTCMNVGRQSQIIENIQFLDCFIICVKNKLFGSVINRTNLCTNPIQLYYLISQILPITNQYTYISSMFFDISIKIFWINFIYIFLNRRVLEAG